MADACLTYCSNLSWAQPRCIMEFICLENSRRKIKGRMEPRHEIEDIKSGHKRRCQGTFLDAGSRDHRLTVTHSVKHSAISYRNSVNEPIAPRMERLQLFFPTLNL